MSMHVLYKSTKIQLFQVSNPYKFYYSVSTPFAEIHNFVFFKINLNDLCFGKIKSEVLISETH